MDFENSSSDTDLNEPLSAQNLFVLVLILNSCSMCVFGEVEISTPIICGSTCEWHGSKSSFLICLKKAYLRRKTYPTHIHSSRMDQRFIIN